MKKIAIYIYEGMADFEISLLCHLLVSDCGVEIMIVSNDTDVIKSKSGIKYLPDETIVNLDLDEGEGLIIPGGWLENLTDELIELVRKLNDDNKLIAAICAAPWILAKAGILEDIKYTTSISEWGDKHKDFFKIDNPFPKGNHIDCNCYRDRNIITAKGTSFIDFSVEVCDYLELFSSDNEKKELLNQLRCS